MGLFSFFSKKTNKSEPNKSEPDKSELKKSKLETEQSVSKVDPVSYDAQIAIFKSLGYEHDKEVSKQMILRDIYEMNWEEETEKYIEQNPFSILYYTYGWRDSEIANYNYSDKCIWFDLEFFDPNSQYKWFMERMGAITSGEIEFKDITIERDAENWEWINFNVNGIPKKWKLEKAGYIADHYVQRFAYLAKELKCRGNYTYYDNGGQQWVIDFATEKEQEEFNSRTGLKREWLGDGNHFNDPPED